MPRDFRWTTKSREHIPFDWTGGVVVERLHDLPDGDLDPLLAESEQAGSRFVRRLAEEWRSGANRFDRPGEALFGARVGGRLVGVCGLNVDPHVGDGRVGRVRHLYVLSSFRRRGVGRRLVAEIVAAARRSAARHARHDARANAGRRRLPGPVRTRRRACARPSRLDTPDPFR